ncbi:MAG: acyltransferase [Bacteroidetes bacterium]|nr:MAG: acyltransferase [Bacteroidota bacterium]
MSSQRRYFETFDAFRFFAFFLVFISHLPFPNFPTLAYFQSSGGTGVTFFFVLSGFLISYLLMEEKRHNAHISLKHFFIRRVLRIWPLFYLMLAFAYATPYILQILGLSSSDEGYSPNWTMSLLFLENYQMIITDSFPNTSPMRVMWSLCIEEHFYILWGIVFSLMPLRFTPYFIGICIAIANVARYYFKAHGWNDIDLLTNIDYFAYGTAAAYVLLYKESLLKQIGRWSKAVIALITTGILFLVFLYPNISYPIWLPASSLGPLFALMILFTLSEPVKLRISDRNGLSKMGVYTYGLYLYHTIVINLLLQLNKRFGWELDQSWDVLGFTALALAMTLVISMASFYLFEKPFIRLKKYFYPSLR